MNVQKNPTNPKYLVMSGSFSVSPMNKKSHLYQVISNLIFVTTALPLQPPVRELH